MYMDVVYPIFPLCHGPTLWERLRQQHHLTDRAFFASIMAACALAAARARDGATGSNQYFEETTENTSEIFFSAAQDALHKNLNKATGLGYLRACALLALTSVSLLELRWSIGSLTSIVVFRFCQEQSSHGPQNPRAKAQGSAVW